MSAAFFSVLLLAPEASAFCGFYVAKADASLYNKASQVVIARHDGRTVISMMNGYEGELKDFALVVPVPAVLSRSQIHIGEKGLFEHLDAYSAPRLVETFDRDPCRPIMLKMASARGVSLGGARRREGGRSLGVTVEASYTVGEYDIVILSATQSDGLETWLRAGGYRIPKGARKALKPYIRRGMKFFVARVNLAEQAKTGLSYLRPLQFAFESEKFMLPIRLGMLNAREPQELLIYMLSKEGRVETTNYRTVELPTGMEVPLYVKDDFGSFYKAMFSRQVEKEKMRAVFTEYVWNMGWCDPCAADPLSREELRSLGVSWLPAEGQGGGRRGFLPGRRPSAPVPVMVTRLHLRYTQETFPEDLMFHETSDTRNFQGRYVLRHPWKGSRNACEAAGDYFRGLADRRETEARTLAGLTGWDVGEIRRKMGPPPPSAPKKTPAHWWEKLWQE